MTGVGIPQENWRINEIYSCEKYQTNSNYCCGVFQIAICAYQRAVFFLGGKGRRPAVHEVWKSFSRTSASMLMGRFLTGCMRKFRRLTESRFRLSSMVDSMIESLLSRTKLGTPCFNPQVESRCKHSNSWRNMFLASSRRHPQDETRSNSTSLDGPPTCYHFDTASIQ